MKQTPSLTVTISADTQPNVSFTTNITSPEYIQQLLEVNVAHSLRLMGIGTGYSVESSGEEVIVEKLKQVAVPDKPLCIFDVGANKGQFLALLEKGLYGIPFQAHAFEPGRHTHKMLCDNTSHYTNVSISNIGLGKQPGEATLHYKEPGAGTASLYKRRLDHFGVEFKQSETVLIDTLDDYCLTHGVQSIDLLKMDVEGHELDVLHGGNRMFNERRVKMVSFEFGGCNIDSRTFFQDFYYFFKEAGFGGIFRIAPKGTLVPIINYKEIYEQFSTTNYLVIRDIP